VGSAGMQAGTDAPVVLTSRAEQWRPGRTDLLPTLILVINSFALAVEDGPASTGRLAWGDDSKVSIFDARRHASKSPDEKSAITEAAEWLENFLALNNGRAVSAEIKAPGARSPWSARARAQGLRNGVVPTVRIPRVRDSTSALRRPGRSVSTTGKAASSQAAHAHLARVHPGTSSAHGP